MKKSTLWATMVVAILTACKSTTFYQVYEIHSQDVRNNNDVLVDENEDCRITYNLWEESGTLDFKIYNKSDKNLYLIIPKSFYIFNGVANDYPSLVNSPIIGVSKTENGGSQKVSMACVPPKSAKSIKGFKIFDHVFKDCENTENNYPKESSRIVRYSKDESPISFKNRIAYTYNEDASDVKYIEHLFWLATYQNFSEKAATIVEKRKECEIQTTLNHRAFVVSAPNKFYNRYSKVIGSKNGPGDNAYLSVRRQRD